METVTTEGDSPVCEAGLEARRHLSNAGHEKSGANQRGPSRKAKYYRETDSEPVPSGKGEKNLEQRSAKDPEIMCLQAVRAPLWGESVPFA